MSYPTHARVALYRRFGTPSEVIELVTEPLPPLQDDDVLVQMKLAPIHPADLNCLSGTYGWKPTLPAVGGNEGLGVVYAIGAKVNQWNVGDRVQLPHRLGSWRNFGIVKATALTPLPTNLTEEQAATFSINPPTAWRLLHDFVNLQPGEWLIQNAANSSVGLCVIDIAHAFGWKTINIVRNAEWIPRLETRGADLVLLDSMDWPQAIAQRLTSLPKIRLGVNAVGGESALRLSALLAQGGHLVTYGAMARQPLKIPNSFLIFNDLHYHGFWLTRWKQNATAPEREKMTDHLLALYSHGLCQTLVEKTYPLTEIKTALHHASQPSRQGKIMLSCSDL